MEKLILLEALMILYPLSLVALVAMILLSIFNTAFLTGWTVSIMSFLGIFIATITITGIINNGEMEATEKENTQ